MRLDCGGKPLDLGEPRVMGVLNVTPDSFSDGGRFIARDAAIAQAIAMAEAGAAIVDVGGESTRPGADPVPEQEELDRVLPVVEAIAGELPIPVSVDTRKPAVMRAAVASGAGLINDVCALTEPGAMAAARDCGVPVCLMHMQGEPRSMQDAPHYDDVVTEVRDYLASRLAACVEAGIPRQQLLLDPGFGFGKRLEHNLALLGGLSALASLGQPLLVGLSRKRMFADLLGLPVEHRLVPSVVAGVLAAQQGAAILRVHDVAETVAALKLCAAVRTAGGEA